MKRVLTCLVSSLLTVAVLSNSCAYAQDASEAAKQEAEELRKQYDRLHSERYYRAASTLYDRVLRYAQMEPDRLTPLDQFMKAFYEGDWAYLQDVLERLPDDFAKSVYDRMLGDLAGRNAPVLTLDDFLGLADACPDELNTDRIRKLGILLRIAVAKEQEVWLRDALQKGTRLLGRSGPKRMVTGRILMHAGFDELARTYLPKTGEVTKIEDEQVRDEILNFLASQEELDQFRQTQIAHIWEQQASVLLDPNTDNGRRQQAADRLAEVLGKTTPLSFEPWIRELLQKDPQAVLRVALALGRRAHGKLSDSDVARRTNNLAGQRTILQLVGEAADLKQAPWETLAATMADWWVDEAEHTFNVHPGYRSISTSVKPHVAPGELLASAPSDAWAKVLPPSLRERIDVCLSKAVLVSDHYQDAVERIIRLADRNPQAGVALAEEYLKAWAYRHDPQVPDTVRRKYNLAADARIVVTPIMMEKNITGLAEMMSRFREKGIPPRNAELLVGAFDVCYSNAEVYQRSHIEKVFGPINKMDENIFSHMIRIMTSGLASRWRTMEVQLEGGTRRTQEETLEMVRQGYETAIGMIDERCKSDRKTWRLLVLAGSLVSDWGDFEYYQQLAGDTRTDRAAAFREKNNLAESYFIRAAESYASQVGGMTPGQYSIDIYLAWFHSLLGINTDGRLNLSKPLDRRALNTLRDTIRALPGDAGQTHINRFAKHVQARLEDTDDPLHEQLKYKYLAGSLVITKESPFAFQTDEKVAYYDQLLDETRLTTRVDGPNTIYRDHEFGIVLSVHHTEALGRMANFGKYLVNELPPANSPARRAIEQRMVSTYQLGALQGRRDELEMNIREALGLFFDVRAIAFSPKDVQPRPIEQPGWQETVLAYIQVKAKDASVDKIPRIQMSLEFLDLTGPVKITAESAETLLKITDQLTSPRPYERVEITQTLDARSLDVTEEIVLQIEAKASGLVPDLEQLLDLEAFEQQLPVARIDPHEGMVLKQVNSWGDTVHAVSERRWTVALDAAGLIDPPQRMDLAFPATLIEATSTHRAYIEMDLVDLEEPAASVGFGTSDVTPRVVRGGYDPRLIFWIAGGVVALVVFMLLVTAIRAFSSRERPLRARDVFHMPSEIDGFAIVQLLRALGSSDLVRLTSAQQTAMSRDIKEIQSNCFGTNGQEPVSQDELRRLARKWLRAAR